MSASRRPMSLATGLIPLALAAAVLPGLGTMTPAAAQSASHEIIITINRVKAVDKLDNFSKADFLARVSIDGETIDTKRVRQQNLIRPNWVIAKRVVPGRHDVKLAILDQDLSKAESVDINRIAGKRDLDFTVDTRRCRIEGFATTFKCGAPISRAGSERKAGEIRFKVEVKKL